MTNSTAGSTGPRRREARDARDDRAEAPRAPVELDLFGGFDLRHEGTHVELPLGAQRVVAFVALAGRPVTRTYLAGSLWSDTTEERAAASLRSALWRIKRTSVRLLDVTGTNIQLPGHVRLDVHEVVRLCRDVLEGEGAADWTSADVERLRTDLLSDWYDDWVMFDRERLQHLRLAALEALCLMLIEAGRNELAVQAGVHAVAAEPLRESAHRVLIEAHLAMGNVCTAAREYDAYRDLVRDELGVEPSPLLRKLAEGAFPAPPRSRG